MPVGIEDAFRGVVDLIEMKTLLWYDEELGAKFDMAEIAGKLLAEAKRCARAHDRGALRGRRRG